jgi:hypothetical protein
MNSKNRFQKFCQRNYYRAFVLLGVGMSIDVISQYLAASFGYWVGLLGMLIAISSAIVLAIGLILEGRQKKQDNKTDSK